MNLRENSLLECLVLSLHITLGCVVFPGIHKRKYSIRNMKELKNPLITAERRKERE
jgi:hypothetical protein